jgi:hypothetical protein
MMKKAVKSENEISEVMRNLKISVHNYMKVNISKILDIFGLRRRKYI